jgi:glycosyltransferase involved in cell wall biosynthesis
MRKRALISYVAWPFHQSPNELKLAPHSSAFQSLEIARAFNRLGYIVDIVDWRDHTFVPSFCYDVFMGMDYNFERLIPYLDKKTVKIYYGTGEYWAYENAAEEARARALMARCGTQLSPRRLKENKWVEMADVVIAIGNHVNLDTYGQHHSRLYAVDNSIVPTISPPDLNHKDFGLARRNFLWMGNVGLLRRGLDLVLEVFVQLRDVDLWVCGPLESEAECAFVRAYRHELFHLPNIHPLGWVKMNTEAFLRLTNMCAFAIYASCTEAMSGSVLNCMGRGLIPLVSQHVGIDTDSFGVTFEQDSVDVIQHVVRNNSATSPEILRQLAQEAYRQAYTRYSLKSFSQNIERVLKAILG